MLKRILVLGCTAFLLSNCGSKGDDKAAAPTPPRTSKLEVNSGEFRITGDLNGQSTVSVTKGDYVYCRYTSDKGNLMLSLYRSVRDGGEETLEEWSAISLPGSVALNGKYTIKDSDDDNYVLYFSEKDTIWATEPCNVELKRTGNVLDVSVVCEKIEELAVNVNKHRTARLEVNMACDTEDLDR